jgi:hypothetical protein
VSDTAGPNAVHSSVRILVEAYKKREENFVGIECAGKLIPIFFLSSHGSEESGSFILNYVETRTVSIPFENLPSSFFSIVRLQN